MIFVKETQSSFCTMICVRSDQWVHGSRHFGDKHQFGRGIRLSLIMDQHKYTESFCPCRQLMDIAMAQQRVPCFIPLSEEHVALLPPLDRFNATTIIHPFSTFRFCWDSFIMIIIVRLLCCGVNDSYSLFTYDSDTEFLTFCRYLGVYDV